MKELYHFGAEWCSACKALWPIVEKEAPKKGLEVKYFDIESDEGASAAEAYSVKSLPTIILRDEQGNQIAREVGNTAWAEIQKLL